MEFSLHVSCHLPTLKTQLLGVPFIHKNWMLNVTTWNGTCFRKLHLRSFCIWMIALGENYFYVAQWQTCQLMGSALVHSKLNMSGDAMAVSILIMYKKSLQIHFLFCLFTNLLIFVDSINWSWLVHWKIMKNWVLCLEYTRNP